MIDFAKSIVESHLFCDTTFLIKRDDLISPTINGNKAYKFYFLFKQHYSAIISYGGNQSNAMVALSYIAKEQNIPFIYFTKPLSSYLKEHIDGNLKIAIDNGMKLYFSVNLADSATTFYNRLDSNAILVPQGGASNSAKVGIMNLAKAIVDLNLDNLCVFCASGTGTSSLFLQLCLNEISPTHIAVVTAPSVGSEAYLKEQFSALEHNPAHHPIIILPKINIPFAKPKREILQIYKQWLESGLEFDLIYDCPLWRAILDNLDYLKSRYKNLLFLHSGGLSGNPTQIKRYKHAKIL